MKTPRFILFGVTALLLLAAPQAVLAQNLGQGASYDPPWWRVIGALLLCIVLAVGAALVLRGKLNGRLLAMLSPNAAPRRLQVIETTRLTPQADVCLLQFDGEEMLVAVTSQTVILLGSKDAAPTPPAAGPEGEA